MKRLRQTLLACLLGLSTAASADPLTDFSRDLTSLQGRFDQQVFDANGSLREQSSGAVAMAVPRQFRWDYQQPFEQSIVADGEHIWIYDPDLEQVTVRNQAADEASSPLMVLADPALLAARFKVEQEAEAKGLSWFRLSPNSADDAPFETCRLGFAGNELRVMELKDQLGQLTVMQFSAWQRNGGLRDGLFRFAPPPGVDIVGELGDSAEVVPLRQE